jgi:hypothetical protein
VPYAISHTPRGDDLRQMRLGMMAYPHYWRLPPWIRCGTPRMIWYLIHMRLETASCTVIDATCRTPLPLMLTVMFVPIRVMVKHAYDLPGEYVVLYHQRTERQMMLAVVALAVTLQQYYATLSGLHTPHLFAMPTACLQNS